MPNAKCPPAAGNGAKQTGRRRLDGLYRIAMMRMEYGSVGRPIRVASTGRRTMVDRRYGHAFLLMALLAILFASVGAHIVHPAFHEHLCTRGRANDGSPSANLHRRAGSQESHPRAGHVCGHGPCPICLLLAAFHATCNLPVDLVRCIDGAPERPCRPAVLAAQLPFWAAHAARAPPLPQPV